MLKVDSLLPAGQVGSSQVSGTAQQVGDDISESSEDALGQLAGSNSGIRGSEARKSFLPAIRQTSREATLDLSSLLGVFLAVLFEQGVPLGFSLGAVSSASSIQVVNLGLNKVRMFRNASNTLLTALTSLETTYFSSGLKPNFSLTCLMSSTNKQGKFTR